MIISAGSITRQRWNNVEIRLEISLLCYNLLFHALTLTYFQARDKHIYANPLNPIPCPFLVTGTWFCWDSSQLKKSSLIFREENNTSNTALAPYCKNLTKMTKPHKEEILHHFWKNHFYPFKVFVKELQEQQHQELHVFWVKHWLQIVVSCLVYRLAY